MRQGSQGAGLRSKLCWFIGFKRAQFGTGWNHQPGEEFLRLLILAHPLVIKPGNDNDNHRLYSNLTIGKKRDIIYNCKLSLGDVLNMIRHSSSFNFIFVDEFSFFPHFEVGISRVQQVWPCKSVTPTTAWSATTSKIMAIGCHGETIKKGFLSEKNECQQEVCVYHIWTYMFKWMINMMIYLLTMDDYGDFSQLRCMTRG